MKNFYLLLAALLLFASCSQQKSLTKTPERKGGNTNVTDVQPVNSIGLQTIGLPSQKNTFNNRDYYAEAFTKLEHMLSGQETASFKDAVFITENAWYNNSLSYDKYNGYIKAMATVCKAWKKVNPLTTYKESDSLQIELGGALYKAMTDTLKDVTGKVISQPYNYNFNDAFADKYWADRFVTNLMATHTGNCHSLPFLYKIVAEELNIPAYLSLLPEHIYIRQPSKQVHWYNTELTSKTFPIDAWLMTSGYVSTDNIVSGLYMDTLGLTQSIVLCINDLAKGYQREFQNNEGNNTSEDLAFIVQCCDLGLKYYPNYGELLLLKAETLKKLYQKGKGNYDEIEQTYSELVKLDYREIPDAMYYRWMSSLVKGDTVWNRKADSLIKPYNPFASIGQKPKGYLTLSKGYYDENFINDTLRQVGSVVFNTVTDKIDHFIQKNETIYNAQLKRPKDDSRFMSIDPMAGHFPNMSPYSFANNNPIAMLDNGGDSTIFYTERGDYLYSTNDYLPNAVVFVPDANMIAFKAYEQSFFGAGNPRDINTAATLLRNQGSIYLIDPIKHFYELHKNDFYPNSKYVHEHGTYWKHIGNIVVPDFSQDIQGTDDMTTGFAEIHTHPNEGMSPVLNNGDIQYVPYQYGPSGQDYKENHPHQFDVAVSKDNIYFFQQETMLTHNPITVNMHAFRLNNFMGRDHVPASPGKSSNKSNGGKGKDHESHQNPRFL